jgi:hypothetical protein
MLVVEIFFLLLGCITTTSSSLLRSPANRAISVTRDQSIFLESNKLLTTHSSIPVADSLQSSIRQKFHEKAGSIHTVLMTRTPGRPLKLGMSIRHGHFEMGMEVETVESGSSADLAGLIPGDIIKRPFSPSDLNRAISKAGFEKSGTIEFLVERDHKQMQLNVSIGLDIKSFGLALTMTSHFDGEHNCKIFQVANLLDKSIAAKAKPSLDIGDVVLAVNGIPASSNRKVVERILMSSARVLLTVYSGNSFTCPSLISGSSIKSSLSLSDHQLRNILDTLSPADISNRLNIVSQELTKLQHASHSCIGSKSCTTGHIERIQQALREETHGCFRAQSMYKLYYSNSCETSNGHKNTSKCSAAKKRTDAAIALQCDPSQREATCDNIFNAWADYYQRRCKLMSNMTKCHEEQKYNKHLISDTCNRKKSNESSQDKKITLPKDGIELDCQKIQEKCAVEKNQITGGKVSPPKVCGSDGKTYNFPCDLFVQSCFNIQRAIKLNKDPLQYSLDKIHSGPCEKCRQISLKKNNGHLFIPGYGMHLQEWVSRDGQSFPQIANILPNTVASNSGHIFKNDIIVMMDQFSTCNKWTSENIMSKFKLSNKIDLTVCVPNAVGTIASKMCPKATLSKCTRLRLNQDILMSAGEASDSSSNSSNKISMKVHQGKCGGFFPMIQQNTFPIGAVGSLLVPGSILFSIDGVMQCNQNINSIHEQVKSMKFKSGFTTTRNILVDICPSIAVESHLVCNYICKPLPPPPLPQLTVEKALAPVHIKKKEELVVYNHNNQNDLINEHCRRVKFIKSKSKYGIDIKEVYLESVRRYIITQVHEGRGLENVDIRVNDTLSTVNNIDVDNIQNIHHMENIMDSTNSSIEIWVSRKSVNHDLKRTLNRDPIGFGFELVESSKALESCPSVKIPHISKIDTLLPGLKLVDEISNRPYQIIHENDYIVRIDYGPILCGYQNLDTLENSLKALSSVVVEVCPKNTMKMMENILCQQCIPTPLISKSFPESILTKPKNTSRVDKPINLLKRQLKVVHNTSTPKIKKESTKLKIQKNITKKEEIQIMEKSQSSICIDSGGKWCPSEFPEPTHTGVCVENPSKICHIQGPSLNPNELVEYCKANLKDPLCSRQEISPKPPQYPFDIPEEQLEPPKSPPPPPDFAPELETKSQICRKGGFCPYGQCPELYIKTMDGYCAPGKNAPRKMLHDKNHICLPGLWCPPGYTCPSGFELGHSGKDGFCFEAERMGPMVPPKFIGADFDPYKLVPMDKTLHIVKKAMYGKYGKYFEKDAGAQGSVESGSTATGSTATGPAATGPAATVTK